MEVAEAIRIARLKSNEMARLARILARLKPVITATHSTLWVYSDDEVTFHCNSTADAQRIADELKAKLEFVYQGAGWTLYASVESGSLTFAFNVDTVRTVRLDECIVKRKRLGPDAVRCDAELLFNGFALSKLSWHRGQPKSSQEIRQQLWEIAKKNQKDNDRLRRYNFVL